VHTVNGAAATRTHFTVCLKGLQPEKLYRLTSAETGTVLERSGVELANGFALTMEKKTGDIWFYGPCDKKL